MYQVIDTHTNKCVGTYSRLKRAMRRADQLDLEYGAVRYVVKEEPTSYRQRREETQAAMGGY